MRDAVKVDQIKEIIRKVDAINIEVSGIAVMERKETFANVIKKRQGFADVQDRRNYYNKSTRQEGTKTKEEQFYRRSVPMYEKRNVSGRDMSTNERKTIITCWNCQENGHMSRNCPRRRKLQCFGCGKEGHMIRDCQTRTSGSETRCSGCKEVGHHRGECPSISCSGCKRRGHLRFQCWNNSENRNDSRITGRRDYVAAFQDRRDDAEEAEARQENNYPNGDAPFEGETIGAMY